MCVFSMEIVSFLSRFTTGLCQAVVVSCCPSCLRPPASVTHSIVHLLEGLPAAGASRMEAGFFSDEVKTSCISSVVGWEAKQWSGVVAVVLPARQRLHSIFDLKKYVDQSNFKL